MASSESTHGESSSEYNFSKTGDRRVQNKPTKNRRRVTDSDWTRWTNRIRDIFFLILGLAGCINQLFFANPPNPVLYPILASLLGAPFALALDEKRRSSRDGKDREEE